MVWLVLGVAAVGISCLPAHVAAQDYPKEHVGAKVVTKWNPGKTECRISVELQNLSRDRLNRAPGSTDRIVYTEFPRILKAGALSQTGDPELPIVDVQVETPPGAGVSVIENQVTEMQRWEGIHVAPARAPWPEIPRAERPPLAPNPAVYGQNRYFPANRSVELGPRNVFRGTTTQTIRFYPVRYNPVLERVQICKIEGTLDVRSSGEALAGAWTEGSRQKAAGFSSALAPSYWRIEDFRAPPLRPRDAAERVAGCDYLAIVADGLEQALTPLVDQKRARPLSVKVVKLSELQITPNDSPEARRTKIRSRIEAEYQLTPRPTYLLLVGDTTAIPPYLKKRHPYYANQWIATDLFYGTLDGSDQRASLAIGRLPARNAGELKAMVEKALAYDKAVGENAGKKWGRAIVSAAYENYLESMGGVKKTTTDRWFHQTAYNVGQYLAGRSKSFAGVDQFYVAFDPDLPKPWFNRDGTEIPQDLYVCFLLDPAAIQSIKGHWGDNTRLVLHRDHGERMGWASPPFNVNEIDTLSAPSLPPVVFSVNCETGWFDHPSQTSFALNLMRNPNGASAVIAASRVSYSKYNDRLTEGLIKGIWADFEFDFQLPEVPEGKRLGPVFNFAKEHLLSSYSDDTADTTIQLFNLFGDPEMRLTATTAAAPPPEKAPPGWEKAVPKKVYVPSTFPKGYR